MAGEAEMGVGGRNGGGWGGGGAETEEMGGRGAEKGRGQKWGWGA